jgi:cbb3-type cytochrome oxidase cytochrome c subunit
MALSMMRLAILLSYALILPVSVGAVDSNRVQDIEPDQIKPGILVEYQDAQNRVQRLEPMIALNVPSGESPHPVIDVSKYTIKWQGTLSILRNGSYRFDANLNGKLTFKIGSKSVFDNVISTGTNVTSAPLELQSGIWPITLEYTATTSPGRLELFWKAPESRRETIPPSVLGHQLATLPKDISASNSTEYGRFLFEEMACSKCHTSGDPVKAGIPDHTGPNLSKIASRTNANWLHSWLLDPTKLRPSTAMPKLFADDEEGRAEAKAVTAYLSTLGNSSNRPANKSRPQDFLKSINAGQTLFTSIGCVACHPKAISKDKLDTGVYGFGGVAAVSWEYPLGTVGSKFTEQSLIEYLQNPLYTNPHGRMPKMNLAGADTVNIARYLLQSTEQLPAMSALNQPPSAGLVSKAVSTDKEKAEFAKADSAKQWQIIGQKLVATKGCVNCHIIETPGSKLSAGKYPALEEIRASTQPGCTSLTHSKGPRYSLNENQKTALQTFLKSKQVWPGNKATSYQTSLAFKRFACLNCHQRDGEGGISNDLAELIKKSEKAENVDDIRPPVLTGVGHKLRTSWFRQLLLESGRSRPWMGLRMPQYGSANIQFLVEGLSRVEAAEPDDSIQVVAPSKELLDAGRLMVGKNGLGCISCHDIAGIPNTGTRGPDLATTNQRVRYDWYLRWLEQPQRMAPNTRMPQIFVNGKSPLPCGPICPSDRRCPCPSVWNRQRG